MINSVKNRIQKIIYILLTNCCKTSSSSPLYSASLPLSLTLLRSSHPPLLCLCACGCATSKSCYCLPLLAAYICLLSVETKETDHKAYYGARSGVLAVCMCAHEGWSLSLSLSHTHIQNHQQLCPRPSPSWGYQ